MGSKGSATTTTTSAPPQSVQDMYNYITQQGKTLQQQPYQQYQGQLVPDINATQQAGIDQSQQYSQAAQPYLQQAGQMTQQAAAGYNPQNFGQGVSAYMSPYMQQAMGATAAQMQNVNQQQQQQLQGNAIQQGAFGGDRGNVAQAALMNQQNLAMGQTLGNMANTGYQSAAQNYMTGLGAQGQLGAQMGNIGNLAQNAGMTGAQQLSAAGAIPYAVQQAQNAAAYQQFAQQQAYPWQTLGSLANMASGLGAGQGGTSTATAPAPNPMNAALGLGTSLLGFMTPSDERLKENMEPIGKTFDGQNLYKYNYKGDPRTQIGLSAQEVEKRNPNAVYRRDDGMRVVDYNDATNKAADRGHFAGGGSSMGGLVSETMERRPYSYGGVGQSQSQFAQTPYADDPLSDEMAALAKITLGSYIPQMKEIRAGGSMPIPTAHAYDAPTFDTSGISGFGTAYKKYNAANAIAPSIAAQGNDIAGLGTDIGSYSLGLNYASGGLVPRIPHADGSSADPEKTVPADQDFLGGLGSSISKGLGGVFGSDTQPGFISSTFNKGQPLSDDARQAMMAAGFGMMASPSPFLTQAIGQGGLIGANTYAKQRQLNYETQKSLAEQAIQSRQVGVGEAGLPLRQQELDIQNRGQALDIYTKFISKYHSDVDSQGNPIMAPTPGSGAPPLTPEEYNAQLNSIIEAAGFSPAVMSALRTSKPRQAQAIGGQSMLPDDGGVQAVVPSNQPIEDQTPPQPIKVAQAAVPDTAGTVATDASQTGDVNPYPDIHPSGTPTYFRNQADVAWKRYQKLQDMGQDATKAFEAWKSLSDKAEGIASGNQQTLLSDGKTYGFPQSIVQKNLSAAAQKAMADAQNADATKFTTENSKFLEELPAVQQVQDGLINAYQKIDMNRTTGFKADAIGIIKGTPVLDNALKKAGVDVDSDGFQGLADTAAKDAIVNAFKAVAANAGGRTTNMQLKEGLMSVAEPVKAPAAKYQVITQDRSNQLRQEDLARDWIDNINNPNPAQRKTQAKFIADWTRDPAHSQKVYDQKAVDQIDYFAGMTPSDIKNLPYKRTETDTTSSSPQLEPWMQGRDVNYSGQRKQFWERDASGKVNWLDADQERKKYQAQQGVQ